MGNGTYNRSLIPRQFKDDSFLSSETVRAVGIAIFYTTSALVTSNFFMNALIIGALSSIWTLINGLQIITHLPVFRSQFPANANLLLRYLIEIANFEVIPQSWLLNLVHNFEDTYPLDQNFYVIGYDS